MSKILFILKLIFNCFYGRRKSKLHNYSKNNTSPSDRHWKSRRTRRTSQHGCRSNWRLSSKSRLLEIIKIITKIIITIICSKSNLFVGITKRSSINRYNLNSLVEMSKNRAKIPYHVEIS